MIDLVLAASREGFLMDIVVPGVVLIIVLILILQQVLGKFGYALF